MKAEHTDTPPHVDLRSPYGVKPQNDSDIVAVLLTDGSGKWTEVKKGSFHYYITGDPAKGEKAIPYISFLALIYIGDVCQWKNVECFPSSLAAFVYDDDRSTVEVVAEVVDQ